MQKQAPTLGRVLVMAGFALSCFGLLLFLWLAFGGAIPLQSEGWRFKARFEQASQLALEADVRISGVPVGRVKAIELADDGRTEVTMELQSRYAPLPSDARAILRKKTLLGETYVELTPGTQGAAPLAENGVLAERQIEPIVELDQILRTFDPPTRAAFRVWQQEQGRGIAGRGADVNTALGTLPSFTDQTTRLLAILDRQEGEVSRLVRDTGVVFGALTERGDQLRSLIENSNAVFETTAARNAELADTFRVLPTFEDESRLTVQRLAEFAVDTNPLITQLRPAARELSPTLRSLSALAPDLRALLRAVRPLEQASRLGLPATDVVVARLRPLLGQLAQSLRQVIPITDFLALYLDEIQAFFANVPAATQAVEGPQRVHYLRTTNPTNPETLAAYPNRIGSNRPNAYMLPDGSRNLPTGLESYETRHCGRAVPPLAPAGSPLIPPAATDLINETLRGDIIEFIYGGSEEGVASPPCKQQAPFGLDGRVTQYPQIVEQPPR